MSISIRAFESADTEAVVALWEAAGLTRPWNDPRADIDRKLRVQPELFLVAEERNAVAEECNAAASATKIVGVVMAGYDGHRGWIHYLATLPEHRGKGLGTALMAEAERRLREMGCPKVQLMVRRENTGVLDFYDTLGYEDIDVHLRGKRLIAD